MSKSEGLYKAAEILMSAAVAGNGDERKKGEFVGMDDVREAMGDLDLESVKKSNEEFLDDLISEIDTLEEADKAQREAEKHLAKLEEALKEIREQNRKRKVLGDTPQTEMLKAKISRLKGIIERAEDKEKFSAYAAELHEFRKAVEELTKLISLGEKVAKDLKRGHGVEEDIVAVRKGYAHYFLWCIDENKLERIQREQLKKLYEADKPFYCFGVSWTFKECPDGENCLEHWFWGRVGDDQSMKLAELLKELANVKYKISRSQRERK